MFKFKHFIINDSQCAQKVGTDSVLLGAWADIANARHILDIGSGSGVLSLMAAQRSPQATVVGVEIDSQAAAQSRDNVLHSPYAQRVEIVEQDVRIFQHAEPFDAILSNPPYLTEETLPPDSRRSLARHAQHLTFGQLTASAERLLSKDGQFHVVLPHNLRNEFVSQSLMVGLFLTRECLVRTVQSKPPRRILLTFSRHSSQPLRHEEIILQNPDGSRSSAYASLSKDFYL